MEIPKILRPPKDLGQLDCSMIVVKGCQGSGGLWKAELSGQGASVTKGSGGRADKAARPILTGVFFLRLLKTPTSVGKTKKGPIQLLLAFPREKMGLGLAGPETSLLK